MLEKLYIRNYAIIDELTIEFDPHLNVITGETGAGKSIILGALSLILGDRVDNSVLINRDEKCIIEAVFLTGNNKAFLDLLSAEELDTEDQTVIRREISATGKSRAFINDTPVKLNVLNRITAHLVDLHRQFDNYVLRDRKFMFDVVDAIAANKSLLLKYDQTFQTYKSLEKAIAAALENQEQWQKEADYKQFLYEELAEAAFHDNEIEEAEQNIKQLSHTEQIKGILQSVYFALEEEEAAINPALSRSIQQLSGLNDLYPEADEIKKRLDSALLELRDIAGELNSLESHVALNPETLQILQERLDLGYRLLKKHQLRATGELIQLAADLETELNTHSDAEAEIRKLKEAFSENEAALTSLAAQLHAGRTERAPAFTKQVNGLLKLIGMPDARLKIECRQKETFDEFGKEDISFLWDANKSGDFQPFQKTASGGELSRIMLCIKTLTAKALALPTLIFDEVDTGISGEAAKQVALLLRSLSESHQVMSITHQAQIAAKGTAHFYVYKTKGNQQINTRIRQLEEKERVRILAQMIGGDNPSPAALKNAEELMGAV